MSKDNDPTEIGSFARKIERRRKLLVRTNDPVRNAVNRRLLKFYRGITKNP